MPLVRRSLTGGRDGHEIDAAAVMSIDLPCCEAPRVSIIIVATSNLGLLRACLRSVARFGPKTIPFETIVVLNGAGPDTEAELRATVTGVTVVRSPVNLGFTGAGNCGRLSAQGEFLILLHDDAEVEPGCMEALVQAADTHPEAGAVGSKVLHLDGRLQTAGMILWSDASSSPPWTGDAPSPDAFSRLRAVDYCGSSLLLVRAVAWDAIGGLDQKLYPVYYADADLGMALRSIGFVVLYEPASRVRHHQGASGNLRIRTFASQRNRQIFIEKWGRALEGHEPPMPQSPRAIARAMARAEAFREECRRRGPPVTVPLPPRAAPDPVVTCYERAVAFQRAYIEHLTDVLDLSEEEREQVRRQARILSSRSALFRRLVTMLISGKRAV
jgi:GT2 family glycosyltransferase